LSQGLRGTSARDALDGAVTAIRAAGCWPISDDRSPRLDAELLLAHVLGVSRERLLIDRDLVVAGAAVRAFQDAVRRRSVLREPVAYIVGRRGFRHLEVSVDPRVLVPRPETELLVEVGLTLAPGARVLDVGTGSGAVALALKHERPDLIVSGSDVSAGALALARANGERLGLAVDWFVADLLEGLPDEFDAVLCNPPYVAESERSTLAPEILRHEPPGALFAGADGLDVIRRLARQLSGPGQGPGTGQRWERVRLLALEVGAGQAPAVGGLLRDAGFTAVRAERDLAGIERVVVGERG
jgi:release factor glutamine methyltransferase